MHIGEAEFHRLPEHLKSRFVKYSPPSEVEAAFAEFGEKTTNPGVYKKEGAGGWYTAKSSVGTITSKGDTGSASRFFYSAKAGAEDRSGSKHPTVKPIALMRWLVRMVCPPGGTVLDPFAGSGTTLAAAVLEGFGAIGIEKEAEYHADILRRLEGLTPEVVQRERFKTNGKASAVKVTTGAKRGRKPKFEIPEDEAEQAEFVRKLRNGELKL